MSTANEIEKNVETLNSLKEELLIVNNLRAMLEKKIKALETTSIVEKCWGRGKKIPRDVRNIVEDLLKSHHLTTQEIAQKTRVSPASIHKLKERLGLVHHHALI